MSTYSLALGIAIAANVALLGYLLIRIRRRLARLALAGFLASFAIANAIGLGFDEGALDPGWAGVGFVALILGYASLALFVLVFLHGDAIRHHAPFLAAVFLPGVALALAGGSLGWSPAEVFQPSTEAVPLVVNAYLVLCLGIALAESLADRQRPGRAAQAFPLVVACVALVVAGPIYGFELVVLRITSFTGTNLAAPVAGALFLLALSYGNPVPFRGRVPEGPRRVPWTVPPGVYLIEETRPKYAQALFLAAAHESAALAILGDSEALVPDLRGVEAVRLPPGPRSAAVLAATTAEFLARRPSGAVLIDDVSYSVTNSGSAATVHALGRAVAGFPPTGRLVVSLAKLADSERAEFRSIAATHLAPPDVESELAAILQTHLGAASEQLSRAAIARGKRVEDLSIVDLPHVRDYLLASLADMRGPADEAAQSGWRRVSEGLAADLEALWRTPPMEARPVARIAAKGPQADVLVVRASDVLTVTPGGETGERVSGPSPQLGGAIRDAFLGSLGPAGEAVYRRVVGLLRKDPASLSRDDLPRVTKLAEEAVADLSGAIDVDAAKQDLLERTRRLRARLNGLARGDR